MPGILLSAVQTSPYLLVTQQTNELKTIIIPMLNIKNWKHREIKERGQYLTDNK